MAHQTEIHIQDHDTTRNVDAAVNETLWYFLPLGDYRSLQ